MNILVTGGAGFIGSHITDKLIGLGHQVTVLDNLSSGSKNNLQASVELVEENICNHQAITSLLTEKKFDAIFHLAAQIDVRASVAYPLSDAQTNILASLHLINEAAKTGVQTFIFSSTGGAIYGDTAIRPTPENHSEHPLSPYGIGKLTIDKYLHFFKTIAPMRTVSLRYANVYGPRQNPHGEAGVVAIFINRMLASTNPVINGDGKQTRDYVFVEDVADANIRALENPQASGVYNIGTGQESTVVELFQHLNTHFKNSFIEQHGESKPGEQLTSSLDSTRANQELNWKAQVSLEQGLEMTYNYFSENK